MCQKSNKLKCRHCGSDDLYLQEAFFTRSDISEDDQYNVYYDKPILYHDGIIDGYTSYGCDSCGRSLTIDNSYGSCVVVTEQNLEEYRQKYCSGD